MLNLYRFYRFYQIKLSYSKFYKTIEGVRHYGVKVLTFWVKGKGADTMTDEVPTLSGEGL